MNIEHNWGDRHSVVRPKFEIWINIQGAERRGICKLVVADTASPSAHISRLHFGCVAAMTVARTSASEFHLQNLFSSENFIKVMIKVCYCKVWVAVCVCVCDVGFVLDVVWWCGRAWAIWDELLSEWVQAQVTVGIMEIVIYKSNTKQLVLGQFRLSACVKVIKAQLNSLYKPLCDDITYSRKYVYSKFPQIQCNNKRNTL